MGAELRRPLAALGLANLGTLDSLRSTNCGGQTLRFGGRIDPEGHFHIGGTAGVIFREVQEVLACRGKSGSALSPTIVMPFHLLGVDAKFFDWELKNIDEAANVASEIVTYVRLHVLPFFDQNDRIESIWEALLQPLPSSWFLLTPEQRVLTLAAIEFLSGFAERAIERLDRALAERAEEPPKRLLELQKLRTHLGELRPE